MKMFKVHNDDCTCQQCQTFMILERIESLEKKLFSEDKTPEPQKSAFQEWDENAAYLVEYPVRVEALNATKNGRKEGWNAAIDAVMELSLIDKIGRRLLSISTDEIKILKEP